MNVTTQDQKYYECKILHADMNKCVTLQDAKGIDITFCKVQDRAILFRVQKIIFWLQHFTATINKPESNRLKEWYQSAQFVWRAFA